MQIDQLPTDNPNPAAPPGQWRCIAALGLILAGIAFAVVSAATRFDYHHGILYVWFGLIMLTFPPRIKSRWTSHVMLACLIALSGLSFLPASWFSIPEWRTQLESAGLAAAHSVTMQSGQTKEYLLSFAAALLVAAFISGWRTDTPTAKRLALVFSALVVVYTVVAILLHEGRLHWQWDTEASFGIFPNRNHTATLLSMGAITSLAVLFFAVKESRGAVAGAAALMLLVILWALVMYNQSRAGLVLPFAGVVLWLCLLGRNWLTRRFLIVAVVAAACAGIIFFGGSSSLKDRFTAPAQEKEWGMTGADDVPRTAVAGGEAYDFRLLIYRDTLAMIGDAPLTGWGPGSFRGVFPQYRYWTAASNNSLIVHPESDWLQLAAECGVPSAILAAGMVVASALFSYRKSKGGSSWPLRLGCLIAALLVPLHGVFDVPGHRLGLSWAAAFLFALSVRKSSREPTSRRIIPMLWRISGLLVIVIGARQLGSELGIASESALARPVRLEAEAKEILRKDQESQAAALSAPAAAAAESGASAASGGDKPDPLEKAIEMVSRAIEDAPLDGDLHFLKGSLALFFTEKMEMALESYRIERLLDPVWVQLPLRQSRNLLAIDADLAAGLWKNAMSRAANLETVAPRAYMNQARAFEFIMRQASLSGELSTRAAELTQGHHELRVLWVVGAHVSALPSIIPSWITGGAEETDEFRQIYAAWKERQSGEAEKWRKTHQP